MCKRNSPCKKGSHEWMCKRLPRFKKKNKKNAASTGCVRETPQILYIYIYIYIYIYNKKASTGCVREISTIRMNTAWDV